MLVFGGSLGARSINLAAVEAFAGRAASACCTSAGGATTPSWPRATCRDGYRPARVPRAAPTSPTRSPPPTSSSRAPGGSVFEIAAYGLPAILVPYPHAAGDHQSANARWMADAGAAVVIPDGELSGPRLGGEVAALLADDRRLRGDGARRRGRSRVPTPLREVAAELLRAARR